MLEVRDVRVSFPTPRGLLRAVDGVSLSLDRGRTLGIVGETGCGKSVLMRTVMQLLPSKSARTSGTVLLDGRELTALSQKELQRIWGNDVGFVFQDPMTSLNPVMKIGQQIAEPMRLHLGLGRKEARERATELLASVGIPEPRVRMNEYPHQLSGGMRQRVTIAIALACEPKLLIADEPTTALDVTVQAQILDLLQEQQAARHMAMIIVTHDLGLVAGRTDEVAVMYAGRVVEHTTTPRLFAEMRMPYTEALFDSIPKLEDEVHSRLRVIGGRPPDLTQPLRGCPFAPRCSYAQEKCVAQAPPHADDGDGHDYACWFPVRRSAAAEPTLI
jgi:oligopeptide/dipeptide ABC transporter ATP-binding protein